MKLERKLLQLDNYKEVLIITLPELPFFYKSIKQLFGLKVQLFKNLSFQTLTKFWLDEADELEHTTYITSQQVNTLRPGQDGRHFPDHILKSIFLNENVWISIEMSLKFVPRGPINDVPALVQIMAWRWPGYKPLSEPMMVSFLTHICVTRPQWVNQNHSAHKGLTA